MIGNDPLEPPGPDVPSPADDGASAPEQLPDRVTHEIDADDMFDPLGS